jgi:diamine N-acetyltransferase
MCADQTEQQKDPWLWRLLVDKSHQGVGVGTFALTAVIRRYRELGMQRVLTAWHPGEGNAGDFYKKFGFTETGEMIDDEIVAELIL